MDAAVRQQASEVGGHHVCSRKLIANVSRGLWLSSAGIASSSPQTSRRRHRRREQFRRQLIILEQRKMRRDVFRALSAS
jgi:hypothetical protein